MWKDLECSRSLFVHVSDLWWQIGSGWNNGGKSCRNNIDYQKAVEWWRAASRRFKNANLAVLVLFNEIDVTVSFYYWVYKICDLKLHYIETNKIIRFCKPIYSCIISYSSIYNLFVVCTIVSISLICLILLGVTKFYKLWKLFDFKYRL